MSVMHTAGMGRTSGRLVAFKAVQLCQQLVEGLVPLFIQAQAALAACTAWAVTLLHSARDLSELFRAVSARHCVQCMLCG